MIAFLSMTVQAFVPNSQKRGGERRPAFTSADIDQVMEDAAASPSGPTNPSATTAFALPPSAISSALSAYSYEEDYDDEQVDVSYGVALVSCVLSLALGFGIGYGV
jgi:hypothetical protein